MDDKELKKYEVGFLVRAEGDKEELAKTLKNHRASIIDDGGISRIKLAYPIKKEDFAYFGYLHFSCAPENIKELRNELKTSPKVLRFIIVSQPAPVKKSETKEVSEEIRRRPAAPTSQTIKEASKQSEALSNEDLEKKLEEILK
jgi:ribosomal protein S6